jgi:hypothetical protein
MMEIAQTSTSNMSFPKDEFKAATDAVSHVSRLLKLVEAHKIPKPLAGNSNNISEWALEEDINHFFYTCEKKSGPGKRAIRLYPEDHAAMAKRLSAAVEGALDLGSDDDGLFGDLEEDKEEENEGKKENKDESKEQTMDKLREEAMARGRAANKKGSSLFFAGYLKEPSKWG